MNKNTSYKARYWHSLKDGAVECELCPNHCRLFEGKRGICYVRMNISGTMILDTYGRSSGFCVDPIEKKPLYHFYPGSKSLSFGTAGCNLNCQFCQNCDISKVRAADRLTEYATPGDIARLAQEHHSHSVSFTYNEPVIFAEYAMDTADACHVLGIQTVAVTNGYVEGKAREDFFSRMDASNVDLKAFTERFYKELCGAKLGPVLDTLVYLKKNTNVWFEVTTLIVPNQNDSEKELHEMSEWVLENLGPDIPWHFSAFHPAYKYLHGQPTHPKILKKARSIAKEKGIRHVYTGNIVDDDGSRTICHSCGNVLIERAWFQSASYKLKNGNKCPKCGTILVGHFNH